MTINNNEITMIVTTLPATIIIIRTMPDMIGEDGDVAVGMIEYSNEELGICVTVKQYRVIGNGEYTCLYFQLAPQSYIYHS